MEGAPKKESENNDFTETLKFVAGLVKIAKDASGWWIFSQMNINHVLLIIGGSLAFVAMTRGAGGYNPRIDMMERRIWAVEQAIKINPI